MASDGIVGLRDSAAKTAIMRCGTFNVETNDIDADYARVQGLGMTFHAPPTPKGSVGSLRACYGRDPEGNIVELIEFLDRSHPLRET